MVTKKRQRLKSRYLRLLKAAGFRSWKRANQARAGLIGRCGPPAMTWHDGCVLDRLQKVADAHADYATNDSAGRSVRRLNRMLATTKAAQCAKTPS